MRPNHVRKRLWLSVGVTTVAAVAATGAFGGSGGGTITTIAGGATSLAMAARRPRRGWTARQGWRWTGGGTSTSPTRPTPACAR